MDLTIVEREKKMEQLRWMLNVDTLTKSKADAQEERERREAQWEGRMEETMCIERTRRSEEGHTSVDGLYQLEDSCLSPMDYMMYNNSAAVMSSQYNL